MYKMARSSFLTVKILSYVVLSVNCWTIKYDTDGDLTLNELVKKLGYDGLESHYVTTPDGYIINIKHIKRKNSEDLMPVLFSHGFTACADTFFMMKEDSPPIFLANNGYDVWLLNNRGTIDSSNHTILNPDNDKEFWSFSWEEIGLYDLPLAIDLVLDHNAHKKLILIGHSEGSTVIFVTLSERPEYNEKVALSIHWGVAVYHKNCAAPKIITALCKLEPIFTDITEFLGIYGLRPLSKVKEMLVQLCRYEIFKQTCREAAQTIVQSVYPQNVDDWSFHVNKWLCGGSLREPHHYMQVGNTGRFARFDHGPKKNLQLYNSTVPPLFHLEHVTSPVVLWCGQNDIFCSDDDIAKLLTKLVNVETTLFQGSKFFTHIDYIVSKAVDKYVYRDLLLLLKKYSN